MSTLAKRLFPKISRGSSTFHRRDSGSIRSSGDPASTSTIHIHLNLSIFGSNPVAGPLFQSFLSCPNTSETSWRFAINRKHDVGNMHSMMAHLKEFWAVDLPDFPLLLVRLKPISDVPQITLYAVTRLQRSESEVPVREGLPFTPST